MLAVSLHGQGFGIGLIFFGVACVIRGALIAKSGVLPRVLGWGLVVAGAAYLVNSLALLLAPDVAKLLFPAVLLPAFVGELAFALWLALRARPAPRATG
jgi:membrane-bound ClpP family serine protease